MDKTVKSMSVDTPIEAAIKKYNVTDAAVTKLNKRCMAIKVIDPGDKKGYALAHDTRMEVKGIRVQIEKTRVELNKDALKYRTAVNKEAKRITALITPLEEYLTEQEKIVEDEKDRIKAEKAKLLEQKINERVRLLLEHGMTYDGVGKYTFLHFSITGMEVTGHSDDVFNMFFTNLKAVYGVEQERLAKVEEDRLKAEQDKKNEDARIKKEQDDEAERLATQKKEQDDAAAKIKADQDKIKADQKVIDDANQKVKDDAAQKIRDDEAKALAEKTAKEEADAKVEKERKEKVAKEKQDEKDEELRKQLLPDDEKLNSLADLLLSCHQPALTHKQSHGRLEKAWKLVIEACDILRGSKKRE